MNSIIFWRDFYSDISEYEDYSVTLEMLMNAEYKALKLERLNIRTISPIYSIRHNQSDRILFTTFKENICILEVVLNHEYAKSKFLRNAHCVQYHLDKIDLNNIERIELDIPDTPLPRIEKICYQKHLDFQEHFIELSDKQEDVLKTRFPFVLHGPAGSGKTTLAISLLQSLVKSNSVPAIYVTQSERLKDYVANIWRELHIDVEISFFTYEEFLINAWGIPKERLAEPTHFSGWFRSLPNHEHDKYRDLNMSEEIIHHEFRIISGCETLEDYLALGKKQSLVQMKEVREELYRLFLNYKASFGSTVVPEFYSVMREFEFQHHVIIDEAQDFSFAQLHNLLSFSGPKAAILVGDHQVLNDGTSRLAFIKNFFFQKRIHLENKALSVIYRCPRHVNILSQQLIDFKQEATGRRLDKDEVTIMEMGDEKPGIVEWIDADDEVINAIESHRFQTPCAIIELEHGARASFHNELHFSPSQCKGLEFDTVMLWKPFFNLQAMHAACKVITAAGDSEPSFEHLKYFNELITAITRSKKRLVIVHHAVIAGKAVREHPFINTLKALSVVKDTFVEEVREFSEQDWHQQVYILLRQGLDEHAFEVFKNRLKGTHESFIELKRNIFPDQSALVIAQSGASGSAANPIEDAVKPYCSSKDRIIITKNNLNEKITNDANLLIEHSFHVDLLMDLFEKYNADQLQSILNCKIKNNAIINRLAKDEACFKNFILGLSNCPQIFNKISSIAIALTKSIKDKESNIIRVLSLIHKHRGFCKKEMQYTLLHLLAYLHEDDLLEFAFQCVGNLKRCNFIGPVVRIALNSNEIKEKKFKTLRLFIKYGLKITDIFTTEELKVLIRLFFDNNDKESFEYLLSLDSRETLEEQIYHIDTIVYLMRNQNKKAFQLYHELGFDLKKIVSDKNFQFSLARLAIQFDRLDVLEFLYNNQPLELHSQEYDEISLLDYAVNDDNRAAIKFLLIKGDTLKSVTRTIAGFAAMKNYDDILHLLNSLGTTDFNEKDHFGDTPLMLAISFKNESCIKYLLDHHKDFHEVDDDGDNLMHTAVKANNLEMVKYLLSKNVSYQIRNNNTKITAFELAITEMTHIGVEISKLLLQSGVDIHLLAFTGISFIDWVRYMKEICVKGNKPHEIQSFYNQVFNDFYRKKHDPSEVSYNGYPLHLATQKGDLALIKELLAKGMDVNSLDDKHDAPIHIAAKMQKPHILIELLAHQADINILNHEQLSPLMLACRAGIISNSLILIRNNAQLDLICPLTHRTAIFWALERNDNIIVDALIKGGVKIDGIDHHGKTLLMIATINQNVKYLENFMDASLINHQDEIGRTALHYAFLFLSEEFLYRLLERGANPLCIDKEANTVLHLFQNRLNNKESLIKKLVDMGINLNAKNCRGETPLMMAIKYARIETYKAFINHLDMEGRRTIDLNAQDEQGNTVMHYASLHLYLSQKDFKNFISLANFEFNVTNNKGQTPAYIAFIARNWCLFEVYMSLNSKIDVKDISNKNLLHCAAEIGKERYIKDFLKTSLFNINETDMNGNSALYYAIENVHPKCVTYLLEKGAFIEPRFMQLARDKGHPGLIQELDKWLINQTRNGFFQNTTNTEEVLKHNERFAPK